MKNPYAGFIRGTWALIAASIAWFLIARATLPSHIGLYFWTIPLVLFCAIALPFLIMTGKALGMETEAIVNGEHLAHWTYGDEERREFARIDFRRQQRTALTTALKAAGGMFLVGAFVLWTKGSLSSPLAQVFLFYLPVGFAVLVGVLWWLWGWTSYRGRLRGPGEVFIGHGGLYENGKLTSWCGPWASLKDVRLETGTPTILCFALSQSRGSDWECRVAVPGGKDDEARKIVQHLRKSPEPSKHRKKR